MVCVPQFFSLNTISGVCSTKSNLYSSANSVECSFKTLKISCSRSPSPKSPDSRSDDEQGSLDPIKLAFSKAKAYKQSLQSNPTEVNNQNPISESAHVGSESDGSTEEIPEAVKVALEKAREYKKNQGIVGGIKNVIERETLSGSKEEKGGDSAYGFVERVRKTEEPSVSSIDFLGLNFADKKEGRRLPAGLVPLADPFPEGDLPEVEIIVGDTTKFGNTKSSKPESEPVIEKNSDLYEPKVSTWGVFPRPNNISKTFGGGRNIRPGEVLETEEDKAAKQARTRKLLAAYRTQVGLNIDPKLKAECEKALRDGDSLMDIGKLKEALPYYQKVMEKLPYQSELHGLAALQWSICQDSLSRPNEARVMYEKLQSHSNVQVSKKARQFMFSFQAMEMMKVKKRSSLSPNNTGYQNYFEAFVKDKANYFSTESEDEEGALTQTLPYIIFLLSPIFLVLLIAVNKGI